MDNITVVEFRDLDSVQSEPMWQYDKGQYLQFVNLEYVAIQGTEVQFANCKSKETINKTIDGDMVQVPNSLLKDGHTIYAYIKVVTDTDETTVKTVKIPVHTRKKPSDGITPDDEENSEETTTSASFLTGNGVILANGNILEIESGDAEIIEEGTT